MVAAASTAVASAVVYVSFTNNKYMKRTLLISAIALLAASCSVQKQTVAILGDSYSTFEGYVPEGYAIWYDHNPKEQNDVCEVSQTWWHIVINDMGYTLERNNSYSGATICYTGYKGKDGIHGDYSDRSFITRACNLGRPDVILVFGGTNDSWCGAPLGDFKWKKWTNEDLYSFRPAMAKMCSELKTLYPDATIVFMLNPGLKDEVNDAVHKICKRYHIGCLDLHDIDKQAGHPSQAGMKAIAEQVEEYLMK